MSSGDRSRRMLLYPALLVVLAACTASTPTAPAASTRPATSPTAPASSSAPATGRPAASSPGATRAGESIVVTQAGVSLPAGLSRAVAFAAGTDILICGGLLGSGATTPAILRVDPANGTATRIGALAVAVHDAAAGALGNRHLVIGGGNAAVSDVVQTCPATGTSSIIGHLPAPRADAVGATLTLNGVPEILVAGGGNGTPLEPDVLETADGITFTPIAALADGVRYPAVAAIDGSVVVIGGYRSGADVSVIQLFDPTTGRTRVVGHLPSPLAHAAAFVLGQQIVVAGGVRNGTLQATVWGIDPTTWVVSRLATLPRPTSDMATVALGDVVYLIGGEDAAGAAGSIIEVRRG